MTALSMFPSLMVSTTELTYILLTVTIIFAVLIVGAIIKMYKLKAENKKLLESDEYKMELEKKYQDFTDGHLYDN